MDWFDLNEVAIKEKKIIEYMEKNNYHAAIIGRRDNFSWLTCGGSNGVLNSSEIGACFVVITEQQKYIIAYSMDAERIAQEQMYGMNYAVISLKWFEKSPAQTILDLINGQKAFSDIPLPGVECKNDVFYSMHYPLSTNEIKKYRWLGRKTEEVIRKVADEIQPGITERQIEAKLINEFTQQDITQVVGIIGSDDRISKYRHCVATSKKVEKVVMLCPAVQKWGITVPISRMIYFGGTLPEELACKYDTICTIEAYTMAKCTPGNRFVDILDIQKGLYCDLGYAEEWKYHFQGGITGYLVNDPTKCTDPDATIQENQTFNWYITITGTKVEETFLASSTGKEILTSTGLWPIKVYKVGGEEFELPQVLLR